MDQQTWIGRSLHGRYKIEALLGQGGMSSVYKALDPNLKRVVAVKLIHPHLLTDEDFIYRFKREAAAVAAFRHPNIVQVYDFNNDNDVYYMILEFVPGETLQDRLKHLKKSETKMPIRQAVGIMLNILDALNYAHKQGMIHRDIKPANIMLDIRGQAILMDFGIVKILDATSHTSTGAVMGTARYMSPEIIRSEMADERSDIYSLGVAFYEMLSGEPPFDADSAMSLLMRHLNDPVPDLSTKRDDLPPELIRIVKKSLEKDRKDRYHTAEDMTEDLVRFLASLETVPVQPAPPTPQADSTKAETRKSESQPKDATEPWNVSSPSLANAETSIEQPTELDQTIPELAQETVKKAHPKEVKPEPQTTSKTASSSPLIKYGAIGVVVLLLIISGIALSNNASKPPATEESKSTESVSTQPVIIPDQATATETELPPPTSTPTETPEPLTPTPTTPYVLITGIKLESNLYVVDYVVNNFTDSSMHVHMFFNTVPPEQAGSPGSGPWKLTWGAYGDPPFTQYGPANRPGSATQMCALVANPNHSIILESGNCVDLPE